MNLPIQFTKSIFLLFLLVMSGCNKQSVDIEQNPSALATQQSGEVKQLVSQKVLSEVMLAGIQKRTPPGNRGKSISISEARIEKTGSYLYAIGIMIVEGEPAPLAVAIELKPLTKRVKTIKASLFNFTDYAPDYPVLGDDGTGEVHTCAGYGCSSCSFNRDNTGKITGCICNNRTQAMGYCNHTVTGG